MERHQSTPVVTSASGRWTTVKTSASDGTSLREFPSPYLQSNAYIRVLAYPGYVEILPVDPAYIYVPVYDPVIVFSRPVGPVVVSAAISFGPPVFIGPAFVSFGWTHPGFVWPSHVLVIDGAPWRRTWVNRYSYVHPYTHPWVRPLQPRTERHDIHRALEARQVCAIFLSIIRRIPSGSAPPSSAMTLARACVSATA